jgi:hypothetical protein
VGLNTLALVEITGAITGGPGSRVEVFGPGQVILGSPANAWTTLFIQGATVRIGRAGAWPADAQLALSTVPATSRFVPEMHDESFGTLIEVTNGVPLAAERSMYWDAQGIFWAGGTNATGSRLP